MQQVMMTGNIVANAESRFTQTGRQVSNFRLAVNRSYTKQNGEVVESTEFFRVTSWSQAQSVAALRKGQMVQVTGHLENRSYDRTIPVEGADNVTVKAYSTDLIARFVCVVLPFDRQNQPQSQSSSSSDESSGGGDFDDEPEF